MKALYSIVAMKFIPGAEEAIKKVAAGSFVYLVREPGNPADSNAVAVWNADGVKLGYLPKAKNGDVGRLIDVKGLQWSKPVAGSDGKLAMDEILPGQMSIRATFLRSPNSGWPQVEVEE